VLDFEEKVAFLPISDGVQGSRFIKEVRVASGSHLAKLGATRVVVEMVPGAGNVRSDVAKVKGGLIVTVRDAAYRPKVTASEVATDMLALSTTPPISNINSMIEGSTADKAGFDSAKSNAAKKEAYIPEEMPAAKEKSIIASALTDLKIVEAPGGSNSIIAKTSTSSPMYKVSRTAPSEFIVRIFGTSVEQSTPSPVISKSAEGLIRAVRATTEGNDTVLRIFAKPESRIDVTPEQDGSLAIMSSIEGRDEIRAQAKPEALTEAPVAKDVPEAAPSSDADILPTSGSNGGPDFQKFLGDQPKYTGRLISLDLQETDIDNALRIIAEVSNLNIIASEDVTGKVTLRLIDVPWDQALDVILKTNGLDKVQEGNVVRIAPVERLKNEREALKQAKQAEEDLEDLDVKYLRVSYARAAELKPLVDSVVTERGLVSYDERTNQIIVRDIKRGLKNVAELVSKIDLRTPQVLLETQIVEATRNLLRDIGSQLGFNYIQSPQTGNATGSNFPNSVQFGGSLSNPAASTTNAVSLLLGSADGTKSLSDVVTALEQEGSVRIISRPSVATTNNKPAVIKSIEKIRIRLPQGGVSVATGQGASAAGQGNTATETIEIGIVLTVTPQASPDYYVLLDLDAKSSTLGTQSVDGIPSEVERSARSSVLISSGQTFALGGIYKTTDQTDLNGLPFFKDVPVLGTFFRRANGNNRDEELLFFVTPRIVEGSFDDASMKATI
jgi:type IV pilus assembly protein PilQ